MCTRAAPMYSSWNSVACRIRYSKQEKTAGGSRLIRALWITVPHADQRKSGLNDEGRRASQEQYDETKIHPKHGTVLYFGAGRSFLYAKSYIRATLAPVLHTLRQKKQRKKQRKTVCTASLLSSIYRSSRSTYSVARHEQKISTSYNKLRFP